MTTDERDELARARREADDLRRALVYQRALTQAERRRADAAEAATRRAWAVQLRIDAERRHAD